MPWINHTPIDNARAGFSITRCSALEIRSPAGEKMARLLRMAGIPSYITISQKYLDECINSGAQEIDAMRIVDKKGRVLFELALPPSDKVCEP